MSQRLPIDIHRLLNEEMWTSAEFRPCTSREDCRHPGGTLPYSQHYCYDEIAHKSPGDVSEKCILTILRLDDTDVLLHSWHSRGIASSQLSVDTDVTSEHVIEWVSAQVDAARIELGRKIERDRSRTVSRKRTSMDVEPHGTETVNIGESESFIKGALSAFFVQIIDEDLWDVQQMAQGEVDATESKLKHEIGVQKAKVLERTQIRKQLSFLKSQADEFASDLKRRVLKLQTYASENNLKVNCLASKSNHWMSYPTGAGEPLPRPKYHSTGCQTDLPQKSQTTDQGGQTDPTLFMHIEATGEVHENNHARAASICSNGSDNNTTAVDIRARLEELETQLKTQKTQQEEMQIEMEVLKFDNADLGHRMALLKKIKKGDEAGIRAKLPVSKDVIERLLSNEKFQTKFVATRKR